MTHIPSLQRGLWFDGPFDRLTVLSKVEGLTTLSTAEGKSNFFIYLLIEFVSQDSIKTPFAFPLCLPYEMQRSCPRLTGISQGKTVANKLELKAQS